MCTSNGEIRKLLNQGFLVVKLKSAYEKIDNPNHDWLTVTELCGKHTGSTAQLEENPFCLLNTPAIFASDSKIFQSTTIKLVFVASLLSTQQEKEQRLVGSESG